MGIRTIAGMTIAALLGGILGVQGQRMRDRQLVEASKRSEWQAQGLESECKSTLKGREFENRMDEQPDGDYQLSVYGGRRLVCEEKDVRITRQPDAEEPLVVECKH